jgi:hypothetical protein
MPRINFAERRAADAARTETKREPFELELPTGEVITLTTDPQGIPLEALEAFEEDRIAGFVKALLADQWPKFAAINPSLADLRILAEEWTAAMGWQGGLGESPASGG